MLKPAGRLGIGTAMAAAIATALVVGCVAQPPLGGLDAPTREARLAGDGAAVLVYRAGLREVVAYVDARPDLFGRDGPGAPALPPREAREAIRATWQRFLDYVLALDCIGRAHRAFDQLDGPARTQAFPVTQTAVLAPYRAALDLLDRLDRNPALDPLLNNPVPELGLPQGTYARIRFRFLNVARATEFAALETVAAQYAGPEAPALRAAIAEDRAAIWQHGRARGETLTAKNALQVIGRAGFAAWFPVQAGVAEWMGNTRVHDRGRSLIAPAQLDLVRFLDGQEAAGVAVEADVEAFRRSWHRPKWSTAPTN